MQGPWPNVGQIRGLHMRTSTPSSAPIHQHHYPKRGGKAPPFIACSARHEGHEHQASSDTASKTARAPHRPVAGPTHLTLRPPRHQLLLRRAGAQHSSHGRSLSKLLGIISSSCGSPASVSPITCPDQDQAHLDVKSTPNLRQRLRLHGRYQPVYLIQGLRRPLLHTALGGIYDGHVPYASLCTQGLGAVPLALQVRILPRS